MRSVFKKFRGGRLNCAPTERHVSVTLPEHVVFFFFFCGFSIVSPLFSSNRWFFFSRKICHSCPAILGWIEKKRNRRAFIFLRKGGVEDDFVTGWTIFGREMQFSSPKLRSNSPGTLWTHLVCMNIYLAEFQGKAGFVEYNLAFSDPAFKFSLSD